MKACFHATTRWHKLTRIANISTLKFVLQIGSIIIIYPNPWILDFCVSCNNLMEVETIKQKNLITYLALTMSCFWLKLFQHNKLCISSTLQESWKTESILLPGTCGKWVQFMNSWIHESMKACLCTAIVKVHENQVMQYEVCFHKFVLQLSRYMKIR